MRETAQPQTAAKWLALAEVAAIAAYLLINADGFDSILFGLLFLPWLSGPALLAALAVYKASVRWAAWCCVVILAMLPVTWGVFLAYLFAHPDAQNGIAIAFFPALQFGLVIVLVLALAVAEHIMPASD